jgi:biotin carboxylase
MKKALILGGGNSELPLIRECTRRGFYTITVSNDRRQIGHLSANKAVYSDYSSFDEIIKIARSEKPDIVIPGANDFALSTATKVAEVLKLPATDSCEVIDTLIQKDKFKEFALSYNIPVGHFKVISDIESFKTNISSLKFPVIVKPVDLTGGKGMSRVDYPENLIEKISIAQAASRSNNVVVEDWFEGTLHSCSMLVKDGASVFEYFDTEYCDDLPFLVSSSTSECNLSASHLASVKHYAEIIIRRLPLSDGILHCQFLVGKGDLRILEYTRRISGDLYSKVVRYVTGVNHSSFFIDQVWNREFRLDKVNPIGRYVSRYCVSSRVDGRYQGLDIDQTLYPFIHSVSPHFKYGDLVGKNEKIATCIFVFPTELLMRNTTSQLKLLIKSRTSHENTFQ